MEIALTGDERSAFRYRCGFLDINEEIPSKQYLDHLSTKGRLDFVCKKYKRKIKFKRIDDIDNYKRIVRNGLEITQECYDLGYGLLCIEDIEYNIDADNNFKQLHEAIQEQSEILLIKGKYEGEFYKCIYGEEFLGLVMLQENVYKGDIRIHKTYIKDVFNEINTNEEELEELYYDA